MVESVCRSVRDGVLQGEFAPALMLLNRSSPHSNHALLFHLLGSLTSSIAAGTAQPKCIVLVAAECSPEFYQSCRGFKEEQLSRLRYVDCFLDPLGWRKILSEQQLLEEVEESTPSHNVCHDLGDLNALLSIVLQSGTLDNADHVHFSVVIDSISVLLAHNSVESIAKFLNNLRSHGKVSSVIWTLHSDLHDTKAIKSLEYMSSIIVSIEQLGTSVIRRPDEIFQNASNNFFNEGILRIRQKRRNGRVREQVEKFKKEGFSLSLFSKTEGVEAGKMNIPQVQFRLQLSDKERKERAKVVLPFEHQGDGRESYIYNGRPDAVPLLPAIAKVKTDLCKLTVDNESKSGQVEYLRDSDDERPDSDEDPDDDLDI
eukprot:c587_g1_i1 orf=164-1276(+)